MACVVKKTAFINSTANYIINNLTLTVLLTTKHYIAIEIFVLHIGIPRKENGIDVWSGGDIRWNLGSDSLTDCIHRKEFPQLMVACGFRTKSYCCVIRCSCTICLKIQT